MDDKDSERDRVTSDQEEEGSFSIPNKNRKVEEERVIETTAKVEEKEEEE